MTERTRTSTVDQIRRRAHSVQEEKERVEFLNTGSVLLNLAASQRARDGGWARGRIINLVGDGSTGKTLLALEAAAQLYYYIKEKESKLFPKVQDVEIVYWNKESVMDFPLEKMYGESFTEAIDWSQKCDTAEAWGRDTMRRVIAHKSGTCFLGILDSIDSLATEGGQARLAKSIKDDKPMDGTYGSGTERAKYFSADFFNNLCGEMKGKDFTLILISQVRDRINAGFWEKKQYRAGGKALDFYTHQVAWLAVCERLKKEWDKQKRIYGITVRAKFERSKVAPPFREAEIDLLFDYGLDDIGSMVEFLPADRIQKTFQERISREKLIEAADRNKSTYEKLVNAVEAYWREIETNTQIVRRPRFGDKR
jgi:recombination protein RecA